MKKIFISTPISGFNSDSEYIEYRKNLLNFIKELKKDYNVYSEIENICGKYCYDTPEDSAINDFKKIRESDLFILHHPQRLQSSTLIELGYAYALNKDIIIISNKEDLPYLSLGLNNKENNVSYIDSSTINKNVISQIIEIIEHKKIN